MMEVTLSGVLFAVRRLGSAMPEAFSILVARLRLTHFS